MPNKKFLLEKYRLCPEQDSKHMGLFPEMMKSLAKLALYLQDAPLRRTVPLILWNEFWLDRAFSAENHTRYKRGRVVYADLGAFNIGSETSYRHPCLILYEGRNWALVAPMTSKKYGDPVVLHYDLSLHYPFDTPTTLQLDAIKVIDKRRILGYFVSKSQHECMPYGVELSDFDPIVIDKKDLDMIDELLARHFTPSLYKSLIRSRYRQEQLEIENELLRQEIDAVKHGRPFLYKASSSDQE